MNKNYTSLNYLPTKVATCCVLHNICEIRADKLTADYFEDIPDEDVSDFALQNIDTSAEVTRNSLTEFFKTQKVYKLCLICNYVEHTSYSLQLQSVCAECGCTFYRSRVLIILVSYDSLKLYEMVQIRLTVLL